jgi:lysozyme
MGRRIKIAVVAVFAAAVTFGGVALVYKRYLANTPAIEPDAELYPIRGIDISAHNGDIDFDRVAADGYTFVMIKASEGTDFKDKNFIDNIRRARQAGLKVGAYHFFRFDTDGRQQAINLLHSLRNRQLDFPAVIDIEEWGNPDGNATSRIIARLRDMIAHLKRFGCDIILYTNKDGYNRFIKGNFDNYPLWLCSFTQPEASPDWTIWQYSHSGSVDGISGKVDLNTIKTDFQR